MIGMSATDITGRIYAGFQIYFGRKQALTGFGDSRTEFLQSFSIALLFYPIFLAILFYFPSPHETSEPITGVHKLSTNTVYYAIAWVYWPLVMASVSNWLGKPDQWMRFVIISNWVAATPLILKTLLTFTLSDPYGELAVGLDWGIRLWSMLIHGWLLQVFFRTNLQVTILLVLLNLTLEVFVLVARHIVLFSGV